MCHTVHDVQACMYVCTSTRPPSGCLRMRWNLKDSHGPVAGRSPVQLSVPLQRSERSGHLTCHWSTAAELRVVKRCLTSNNRMQLRGCLGVAGARGVHPVPLAVPPCGTDSTRSPAGCDGCPIGHLHDFRSRSKLLLTETELVKPAGTGLWVALPCRLQQRRSLAVRHPVSTGSLGPYA